MHPMYNRCSQLINRPVTVHLVSGRSHYGSIQRVSRQGIFFMPMTRPASSTSEESEKNFITTELTNQDHIEIEEVFFPFFFPFALLAGFTLGFAAGSFFPGPFFW